MNPHQVQFKELELKIQELETSRRELAAIVEESHDAIIGSTIEGEILSWNKGARRIFDYAAEEVIGRRIEDVLCPDHKKEFEELLRKITAGFPQTDCVSTWVGKAGERVDLEFSVSPAHGINGVVTGASIVAHDITKRRAAEARQARTDSELRQSQKMEVAGRLASGIAHDFNNILTAIFGYSELVLRAMDSNDPLRTAVEEIISTGERAASMTRQLLAFSRKQVLDFKVLDIDKVAADMQSMLRRLINEDIKITFTRGNGPSLAKVDLSHIQQVILNLIVNARDSMPKGGKISIDVRGECFKAPYFSLFGTVPPGNYTALSVADTGCGMTDEVKSHIFEPFFTTKEIDKGTGLGLSTIYGIIKQSNGYIDVDSAPGKGTVFKVYLPQAMPATEPEKQVSVPARLFDGTATILLVEDDIQIRRVSRHILEEEGYTVFEAGDGEEALDICQKYAGPLNLMLTDMVMPGMSGPELAKRLSARWPSLKVVFISGYVDHPVFKDGITVSARSFIQKPFMPAVLIQAVKKALVS